MQRYFVKSDQINECNVYITDDDYYHITKVMRMKEGTKVYVSDEVNCYLCTITSIDSSTVTLKIDETLNEDKELKVNVTIAHGLVRREKAEEVIDYITELGAYAYLPVQMQRSIVKVNNEKLDKKNDRFNKIAKEASEQAHRTKIMKVLKLCSFKELLEISKEYDLCLYAYEAALEMDSFKRILKTRSYKNILVLVGPEGGISEQEVKMLNDCNFLPITLGPRILRTQVAPIYILSAISYELEAKE